MNWNDSQMASQAFGQGHGGMSLGQQWALAALLRGDDSRASIPNAKNAEKIREIEERSETLARCDEKYRQECVQKEAEAYQRLFNELGIEGDEQKDFARQFIESLGMDITQL